MITPTNQATVNQDQPGIKINSNNATVTLSGDAVEPGEQAFSSVGKMTSPQIKEESSIEQQSSTNPNNVSRVVPELPVAATSGIVTAGKGSEMLNILVNDSFSTNKSGKIKKAAGKKNKKGGGGKEKKQRQASIMGYSAMEILQMKDAERKLNEKP